MAFSAAAVAYCVTGGLILFSGIRGATISDTVKSALSGNLNPAVTENVNFSAAPTGNSDAGATGTTTGGKSSNSATENQNLAKKIIQSNPAYAGWDTGENWSSLVQLWTKESGWDATADNAQSGAYGIAQSLPATKYPVAGQPPPAGKSDPGAQISWGLSYILGRYGNPVMAWAHEVANNWY